MRFSSCGIVELLLKPTACNICISTLHLPPLTPFLSFFSFRVWSILHVKFWNRVSPLVTGDGIASEPLKQFGQKKWVDFPKISAVSAANLAKISALQGWKWVTSNWAIKPQEGKGLVWSARITHFPPESCLLLTNGTGSRFEPNPIGGHDTKWQIPRKVGIGPDTKKKKKKGKKTEK